MDGYESNGSIDSSQPRRVRLPRLSALLALVVSLVFFGFAAHDFYAYRAGTPTHSKLVNCSTRGRTVDNQVGVFADPVGYIFNHEQCLVSWNDAEGHSHSGPMAGWTSVVHSPLGLTHDVRVYGEKAYAANSGLYALGGGAVALLAAVFVFGGMRFRR